jgi:hypothetical protein
MQAGDRNVKAGEERRTKRLNTLEGQNKLKHSHPEDGMIFIKLPNPFGRTRP